MKLIQIKWALLLLILAIGCAGCKSSALKDAGNSEKDKEQAQVDARSSAVDKLNGSASSSPGSN